MEYEAICLSIGVIRIIRRLFQNWTRANESWNGRSGQEIWLEGFKTLVGGLIERLVPCIESASDGADSSMAYLHAISHEILGLVSQVQAFAPDSKLNIRHMAILVDLVESVRSYEVPKSYASIGICGLACSGSDDMPASLLRILTMAPVKRTAPCDDCNKVVLWTMNESYRSVDRWLFWLLKSSICMQEGSALVPFLSMLPIRKAFCPSLTWMLVVLNLDALRKQNKTEGGKRTYEQGIFRVI